MATLDHFTGGLDSSLEVVRAAMAEQPEPEPENAAPSTQQQRRRRSSEDWRDAFVPDTHYRDYTDETDSRELLSQWTTRRRWRASWSGFLLLSSFLAVVEALFFLFVLRPSVGGLSADQEAGSDPNVFPDALRSAQLHSKRFTSSFQPLDDSSTTNSSKWGGPPSRAIDDAWTDLLRARYFRLKDEELWRFSTDPDAPEPQTVPRVPGLTDRDGVYATLDVAHGLACVDLLRKHADYGTYSAKLEARVPAAFAKRRAYACVDFLRESLLCAAGTAAVPARAFAGDKEQRPVVLGETGLERQCRDGEAVLDWMRRQGEERGVLLDVD